MFYGKLINYIFETWIGNKTNHIIINTVCSGVKFIQENSLYWNTKWIPVATSAVTEVHWKQRCGGAQVLPIKGKELWYRFSVFWLKISISSTKDVQTGKQIYFIWNGFSLWIVWLTYALKQESRNALGVSQYHWQSYFYYNQLRLYETLNEQLLRFLPASYSCISHIMFTRLS